MGQCSSQALIEYTNQLAGHVWRQNHWPGVSGRQKVRMAGSTLLCVAGCVDEEEDHKFDIFLQRIIGYGQDWEADRHICQCTH